MSRQHSQPPIHMKRVPSLQIPKSYFTTPKANRYFQKIMRKNGILAASCQQVQPHQKQRQNSIIASRSVSLQMSKRQIQIDRGKCEPKQSKSLPKINNKKTAQEILVRQIMGSELGYLNFYSILKAKNKQSDLTYKFSHDTRESSMISQEEPNQMENSPINQTETQIKYDDYDKMLMKNQPVIFKRRYFRLKHKAEWGTSK